MCPKCGTPLHPTAPQQGAAQKFAQQFCNTSQPRPTLTPEQEQYLDKFHWGPFTFSWIWALCNDIVLYGVIALIACIFTGIGGLIVSLIFGFKGNRWAWEKSKMTSFEGYVKKQESWDKWGKILFFAWLIIIAFCIFIILLCASIN